MMIDTDFEDRLATMLHDRAEAAMSNAGLDVPLVVNTLGHRPRVLSLVLIVVAAATMAGLVTIAVRADDTTSDSALGTVGDTVSAIGAADAGVAFNESMTPNAQDGQTASVSLDVPPGSILRVSSLVVRNPGKDTGVAILLNNTSELFRTALGDVVDEKQISYTSQLEVQGSLVFQITCTVAGDPSQKCTSSIVVSGTVVPAHNTADRVGQLPSTSTIPATVVQLTATSPVLSPTTTLFDLTGFDTGALAVSPDGRIVAGKAIGALQHLFELRQDTDPLDLGIELSVGASLAFGPHGDLFTVEHSLDGTSKVSEYRPTPDAKWTWIASAQAGVKGECGITVTPASAGCPGTGPVLEFNPPVDYDRVEIDQSLSTITRTSGEATRQWSINLDLLFAINCEDRTCAQMSTPGPDNSAVWFPYLYGQQQSQAVFVLDDRPVAGAAWLDPRINNVIGIHGTDLIAVQTANGRLEVVAVDLSTILA